MPGAFSFDCETEFSKPVARPSFYIPPSPSASSVLSSSITRTLSNPNLHCRKRPRIDSSRDSQRTPRGPRRTDTFTSTFSFGAPSPAPLVNVEYRLAGGLDTPTAEKLRHEEQAQYDFEQDLRPNRYTFPAQQPDNGYFPQTPSSADLASRKRLFPSSPSQARTGLVHTVWAFTGGVAGKVINFCWNTAFHGFHAGGGQGYHMQTGTPMVVSGAEVEVKRNDDVFDTEYQGRGLTPIPGGFPGNFIEDYMSRPQSHQQLETPTQLKDTGGNWVMVNEPYDDRETSPARKRARPSTAMYSRPLSRGSLPISVRPRMPPRSSASGASYASPRGNSIAAHSQARPQSSEAFSKTHKRSRSSVAQTRHSGSDSANETPKSPEVLKFERKLRKKDVKQDRSITRLNQQMQDMIKEAQQALGSKVEVTDAIEDGDDESGTEISMVSRW